jgi:hypothetical protein
MPDLDPELTAILGVLNTRILGMRQDVAIEIAKEIAVAAEDARMAEANRIATKAGFADAGDRKDAQLFYHAMMAGFAVGEQIARWKAERPKGLAALGVPEKPPVAGWIKLTTAEVQSRSDRVAWAEGLILQLPADHDGRNSWLLNFGRKTEAVDRRERRGVRWIEETQSAEVMTTARGAASA